VVRRLVQCLLLVAGLNVPAGAQPLPAVESPQKPSATFRSGAELVALSVAVLDPDQRFVQGLSVADFAVFEDGVQQDLTFFAASQVPLDLILLLDTSASMGDKIGTLQAAASGFLQTLRTEDRGAVIVFSEHVRVLEGLTADVSRLRAAVGSTEARGATALHNAIYIALREFGRAARESGEVRRQAIAVFSDGDDTSSLLTFDEVLEEAKRAGVTIYTVSLRTPDKGRGPGNFSQSLYAMRTLARETGAQAFFPQAASELSGIYAKIAEELEHQYAIGYMPKNRRADGRFRRVVVQVVSRPELRPRARLGYYADRQAATSAMPAPGTTAEIRHER
jgi:Ca-activated chloride channel homolog